MKKSETKISISRTVHKLMSVGPVEGKVFAVFQRVANLLIWPIGQINTDDASMITIAVLEIGNGPQNILLDRALFNNLHFQPGDPVKGSSACLLIGDFKIALDNVTLWDPRPDWENLRALDDLRSRILWIVNQNKSTLSGSLYELATGRTNRPGKTGGLSGRTMSAFLQAAQRGMDLIREGWEGDWGKLKSGATLLAGLGSGLTPAGDDFLVGLMHYTWLVHPSPISVCQVIFQAAGARTNMLSRSFLRSALAGECNESWHDLFLALESRSEAHLEASVERICSFGSTSGSDALAGFVWMAL